MAEAVVESERVLAAETERILTDTEDIPVGDTMVSRRALAHDIGPAHKSIRLHTPNARVEIDGQVLDMQITCEWALAPVPEAVRLAAVRARRPIGGFSRWVEPEPDPDPETGLDSDQDDEPEPEPETEEACCGR